MPKIAFLFPFFRLLSLLRLSPGSQQGTSLVKIKIYPSITETQTDPLTIGNIKSSLTMSITETRHSPLGHNNFAIHDPQRRIISPTPLLPRLSHPIHLLPRRNPHLQRLLPHLSPPRPLRHRNTCKTSAKTQHNSPLSRRNHVLQASLSPASLKHHVPKLALTSSLLAPASSTHETSRRPPLSCPPFATSVLTFTS